MRKILLVLAASLMLFGAGFLAGRASSPRVAPVTVPEVATISDREAQVARAYGWLERWLEDPARYRIASSGMTEFYRFPVNPK